MKELYSIGEVSALFGISAQSLRFYSNNGLIIPKHTDPASGYRFYSYDQFHLIDRIKYLQGLGFSLEEIKNILKSGEVEDFLASLKERLNTINEEIKTAQNIADNLEWYIDYYNYLGENKIPDLPYRRHIKERYILCTSLTKDDPLFGPAGYNLAILKQSESFKNLEYLRQVGYILDFEELCKEKISSSSYYIYLKNKPQFEHTSIKTIPEGEYLCFRIKLLSHDGFDFASIKKYLERISSSALVLADEYEDNLTKFDECIYEVQILL